MGDGGGGYGGDGGGKGGAGGGGKQRAESPANSRLRPAGFGSLPVYATAKVMSTYPWRGWKKSCTARLACTSVRSRGSLGLSAGEPVAVDVKVPVARLIASVVEMSLPDDGRSGDTKYAKLLAVTLSVYSPVGPVSRSKIDRPTIDVDGSVMAVFSLPEQP